MTEDEHTFRGECPICGSTYQERKDNGKEGCIFCGNCGETLLKW